MKYLMIIIFLLTNTALAKDEWFCSSQRTERKGNTITVCGHGKNVTPTTAQVDAMDDAILQFKVMCAEDDTCRGHAKRMEAKRTECESQKIGWMTYHTCIQAVSFEIGDKI